MRKSKYNNLNKDFLYNEHWLNNKTLDQIARENNIAEGSMDYIFKKFNIPIRSLAETNKLLNSKGFDENKVIDLYINQHKSLKEIAEIIGSCQANIFKILKRNNIERRSSACNIWNKGLNKNDPRVIAKSKKQAETLKVKYALGEIKPWNKGLTADTDKRVKLNIEKILKNRIYISGESHPCYGKPLSEETRRKLSIAHGGNGNLEKNRKYGLEFNERLKEKIRFLGNYKCQLCGCPQIENEEALSIHHVDYNKKNNNINNLIALCRGCHSKTNINRNHWINHLQKEISWTL